MEQVGRFRGNLAVLVELADLQEFFFADMQLVDIDLTYLYLTVL